MGAGIGITVAIVLSNYEELIFALTPSVATVIIYTGVFEAIITKIEITILMAMCLSVPHIAHSLWLFIRPGLHTSEAKNIGVLLMYAHIASWGLVIMVTTLISSAVVYFSSYYNIYVPTQAQTYIVIEIILAGSVAMAITPLLVIYLMIRYSHIYVKGRFLIIYAVTMICAVLLPPDIISLVVAGVVVALVLEISYMWYIWTLKVISFFLGRVGKT